MAHDTIFTSIGQLVIFLGGVIDRPMGYTDDMLKRIIRLCHLQDETGLRKVLATQAGRDQSYPLLMAALESPGDDMLAIVMKAGLDPKAFLGQLDRVVYDALDFTHFNEDKLHKIVAAGVNPHIGNNQDTPFNKAVRRGRSDLVAGLLTHGALIEDELHNPLFSIYCASSESDDVSLDLAKILVEHGAKIDEQNTLGMTALMTAVAHGDEACVSYLLSQGARLDLRDNDGMSALQLAVCYGSDNVIRGLLPHIKDTPHLMEASSLARNNQFHAQGLIIDSYLSQQNAGELHHGTPHETAKCTRARF